MKPVRLFNRINASLLLVFVLYSVGCGRVPMALQKVLEGLKEILLIVDEDSTLYPGGILKLSYNAPEKNGVALGFANPGAVDSDFIVRIPQNDTKGTGIPIYLDGSLRLGNYEAWLFEGDKVIKKTSFVLVAEPNPTPTPDPTPTPEPTPTPTPTPTPDPGAPPSVSVDRADKTYAIGQNIIVSYVNTPNANNQWIGMKLKDAPISEYVPGAWQYTTPFGNPSGQVTLGTTNVPAGNYDVFVATSSNQLVVEVSDVVITNGTSPITLVPPTLNQPTATTNTVTLSWSNNGNPTNIVLDVRRAIAPYGEENYVTAASLAGSATGFVDASVSPGVAYRYRIRANHPTTPSGTVVSNYRDITTGGNPPSIVLQNPTLYVPTTTSSTVSLTWNNNGNPTNISIDVRRAVSPYGEANYVTVATLSGSATSYTDSGLTPNSTFRYRIRANHPTDSNANGVSNYQDATTTSGNLVLQNPILNTPSVTANSIALTWSNNGNPTNITIDVRRAVSPYGEANYTTIATLSGSATSYNNTGLSSGASFRYRIRANHPTNPNANGVSNYQDATTSSGSVTLQNPVLNTPSVTSSSVSLTWSNNGNPTNITIDVRRAVSPYGEANYSTIATLSGSATSYSNTGLTPSSTFRYRIRANHPTNPNANGVSNYQEVTTNALNNPVLNAPTIGATSATLTWSNNGNPTNITIDVRRSVGPDFENNYQTIATLSGSTTSYNATGLSPGILYRFRIRANHPTNATVNGVSNYQEFATPLTLNNPVLNTPTKTATSVSLSWSNSGNPSYITIDVRRAVAPYGEASYETVTTLPGTATSYTNTGLTTGTAYRYRIRANHPSNPSANGVSNFKDITPQ